MLSYNKSLKALLGAAMLISLSQPMHAADDDGDKNNRSWSKTDTAMNIGTFFVGAGLAYLGKKYADHLKGKQLSYDRFKAIAQKLEADRKAAEERVAKLKESKNENITEQLQQERDEEVKRMHPLITKYSLKQAETVETECEKMKTFFNILPECEKINRIKNPDERASKMNKIAERYSHLDEVFITTETDKLFSSTMTTEDKNSKKFINEIDEILKEKS
jgi:hypothetical protein